MRVFCVRSSAARRGWPTIKQLRSPPYMHTPQRALWYMACPAEHDARCLISHDASLFHSPWPSCHPSDLSRQHAAPSTGTWCWPWHPASLQLWLQQSPALMLGATMKVTVGRQTLSPNPSCSSCLWARSSGAYEGQAMRSCV